MASIKNLKKDIDYLTTYVLSDCFQVMEINGKVDEVEIMKIVEEVVENHSLLRKKVQHPDGSANPKLVKTYYKGIAKELLASSDAAFEKLSVLVRKSLDKG